MAGLTFSRTTRKMKANKLLEWQSTDGDMKCLLWVVDESLDQGDVDHEWLEVATFDGTNWNTEDRIDFVETFEDYGIPEDIL